jgi:RNA polymerase sigma factor (sigma-70 family)
MKDEYQSTERLAARLQDSRSWLVRRLEAMLGRDGSAEETAQEAFMRVLENPPSRGDDNIEGFLWRVAQRLAIDELRKRRSNEGTRTCQAVLSVAAEALDAIIRSAERQELLRLIQGLSDGQRICIKMFYFQGVHYEGIARTLNISTEQVKAYIQNGKIQLKRRWRSFSDGVNRGSS